MKRLLLALAWLIALPLPVQADDGIHIPLIEGLVLSYAQQTPAFDEEFLITVTAASEAEVEFAVVTQRALKGGEKQAGTWIRRVRRQDLLSANRRNPVMQDGDTALFPGATFTQLSATVLEQLKAQGESAVIVASVPGYGAAGGNALLSLVTTGRKYYRGPMQRVGMGSVQVLVNGKTTALPAIHTQGRYTVGEDVEQDESWWLDDADNALPLRTINGTRSNQLVRIDYPTPPSALEAALSAGDCRAALHGIYFNTGSATLLAQSEPALQQIAALLTANPGWKVAVEGHTDTIGGDAYNLDLSQRRAAAVRDALATRGIDAKRLTVAGHGATRPVGDNATLEGRAANRRVELSRQCP